MKTINFQLSSQKCIDEGYVIRPPSPLADQEFVANPFEIEPMEWFTAGVGAGAAGDTGSDYDGSDDESPFTYREKVCGICLSVYAYICVLTKYTCIDLHAF